MGGQRCFDHSSFKNLKRNQLQQQLKGKPTYLSLAWDVSKRSRRGSRRGGGQEAARAVAQKAPKGALRRGGPSLTVFRACRAIALAKAGRSLTEGKRKPVSLGERASGSIR